MANYAEKPQMGFIEACSTACKKIVTFQRQSTPLRVLVGHIRYIHHQPHHLSTWLHGNNWCYHLQPSKPRYHHFILITDFPPSA